MPLYFVKRHLIIIKFEDGQSISVFRRGVAIDAAVNVFLRVGEPELVLNLLLNGGYAARVLAGVYSFEHAIVLKLGLGFVLRLVEEFQNERHADIFSAESLVKVAGAGVGIDSRADFVDPRERVHNAKVALGGNELLRVEDVAALETEVFLLARKALALDTGHIENVKLGHCLLKARGLEIGDSLLFEHVLPHVFGNPKLLRGDEHEFDAAVS